MRRTFTAVLCALVVQSCADYQTRRAILDTHRADSLSELRELTLAAYREWAQQVPRDCHSPKLLDARASVLNTALMIKPGRDGFEAAYDAASWMLDVAEGAAANGCVATARDLYIKVRGLYTGSGYVRLRERASVGVERLGS
jgi:hypothetical protein